MVRRRWTRLLLCFLVLGIAVVAASSLWLPWIGYALIRDEGAAKADLAVVLAGDSYGHRIEKAAELIGKGYVPAALVSGPPSYGVHECDLAIAMMVREGRPANWFIAFPNETKSTTEEAQAILGALRERGVRSFLLVTSTFHTARAARTFRAVERRVGGPSFRVVASDDEFFRPGDWWRSRESQKTVVLEWIKTVAFALGK